MSYEGQGGAQVEDDDNIEDNEDEQYEDEEEEPKEDNPNMNQMNFDNKSKPKKVNNEHYDMAYEVNDSGN